VVTIVVIGLLGSGKSSVSGFLAKEGCSVIDFDDIGHEVLSFDEVKRQIKEAFGEECFNEEGEILRHKLAQRAFQNTETAQQLTSITWPTIFMCFDELVAAYEREEATCLVIEESAFQGEHVPIVLHDEQGNTRTTLPDVVIAVSTPFEMRLKRALQKGMSEADVRARMNQQLSDADLCSYANVVFENTGTKEDLRKQVHAWWTALKADARFGVQNDEQAGEELSSEGVFSAKEGVLSHKVDDVYLKMQADA